MPADPTPTFRPWETHPSPEILDSMVVEVCDTESTDYKHYAEGTPHPNYKEFPNHQFCYERALSWNRSQRYWTTDFSNQDLYNYDIGYSGESESHPIYVRRYRVLRTAYVPMARGTNMTGVWQVRIVDGGSGYDPKAPPTVTISGGSGSGATAVAYVNALGVVEWIRVTAEGTGYLTAPTVLVAAPVSGSQATATAVIQRSFTNSVASVTITNPGANYLGFPPLVQFSSGSAAAAAYVSSGIPPDGGRVVAVNVTDGGSDYVVAPGVTFVAQGLGSGATGEAVLEERSLTLVKEDVQELPADDPVRSLYVLVTRVFETLPGPVLTDWNYDQKLKVYIQVQKRVVLSSSVPPNRFAFPTIVDGTATEYQSTPNKNRSIQIVSSIPSEAPDGYQFFSTINYRFPDTMVAGTLVLAYVDNGDQDHQIAQDVGVKFNIIQGYAGPCTARISRAFTYTPDEAWLASLPAITVFRPEADTIVSAFTLATEKQTIARVTTWGVPQTLHPAITFTVSPAFSGSGSLTTPTLSATVPPTIPTGWIVVDIKATQDERFGLWIYDVVEVQNP